MNEFFKAPWSGSLFILTTVSSFLLVGIALTGIFTGPRSNFVWILAMVVIPLLILFSSALFTIMGYILTNNTLLIQHIGWNSKIDLQNLMSADVDSQAMHNSVRTWGNGGMFSFSGWFYNSQIGAYQAYATDPQKAVILRFPQRTVIVTPEDPARFVSAILERRPQ